jgi:hypothetical protein
VTATADNADPDRALAAKLAVRAGLTIQQIGFDEDCAPEVGTAVVSISGSELVDIDFDDVVDMVLLWWRADDGDLVDALVDAIGPLTDQGVVWLLTPKPGRPGHVEPQEIAEAAPTAGLAQTSTVSAARDWQGTRLVAPRAGKR